MKYRIQSRKMSTDIIEVSYDNGRTWKPYLAPLIDKIEGDRLINRVLEFLNKGNYDKKDTN